MMANKIKTQSLKSNFVFQILYQVIILVIPLVVSPYLTRVLGDTSLGIYSYTYSVAYYFVIFAMLGILKHGQRIIASRRDNEIALRKTFWSLYSVHALFSFIAIIAYIIFALTGGAEYKNVYLIQLIFVASALFDITWLFYGLENFKSVVIRNLIIKIAECTLVFCLVKTSADLWIYTLIMSLSLLLGQAVMLPQAIFKVKPVKFGWNDVKEHFKPLFVLFVAVVASTLYTVFDKTLLGIMTVPENVAYYEYSNKIISIPKTIIAVIGTVMFPRACACIANGDQTNAKRYMDYSLQFTAFIGIGALFGLLGISNLLAVLYYGESFAACGNVIMALSPAIFIIGLGDIVRTQYLIPNHKDNLYIICLILNAVINIILSIALIPVLGIYGAVIGTLAAELFGLIFQLVVSRKFLPIKTVLISVAPYVVCGAVMYGVIFLLKQYYNSSWLHLLAQVFAGGAIYLVLSGVYLFKFSPIKNHLKDKILKKLKKPFHPSDNEENNIGGGCKRRDNAVDYLKIIGTFLIILAHVTIPDWLKNIRIFDVVVLVFVSAVSFSYSKPINSLYDYLVYVWKRIKRLVFYTWIYISVYLVWLIILNAFGAQYDLSFKAIVSTYTLIGGVGYVWIIRIYLCMALIAPMLRFVSNKIKREYLFIPLILFLIALNSTLVWSVGLLNSGILNLLLNTCILPILGYGIVYFLGIRFAKLNFKNRLIYCFIFLILFVLSCIFIGFDTIQTSKYPPAILYLSYGLLISGILYSSLSFIGKSHKILIWLSNNSLGIYFNHIFMISLIDFVCPDLNFAIYFAVSLGFAIALAVIINLINKFIKVKIFKKIKLLRGSTKMKYDYLVVGAGLYGAVFAREAADSGKKVLVVDKRPHIAGNVYTEEIEGINVHKYGAHIFHTNNKEVWNYVNRFAEFNRFTNSPVANYRGELYSLPFNMYTFNKMWGVTTPEEAEAKIKEQRESAGITEPKNLEEQAISLVGKDIYEKLIKGYTEKQWGRPCSELPSFIIKRLPVRFTFDNNYFNALYQGIPEGGYTKLVENMLSGIEVRLNTDYIENKEELDKLAKKVVFTGPIDAYFGFRLGALEYRSVRFENEVLDKPNFQGNAAVNYTDSETPWTRIIEHKWFEFGTQPKTVISREYSSEWKPGDEPYYPVNDEKNGKLYEEYKKLAETEANVIFGGRLGEYKYYDMDKVIESALNISKDLLARKK